MEIESKFRIKKGDEKVFGKGPCLLLETIDRLGSLNKASSKLNISYSKAWSIINRAEQILGYSLLETQSGGSDGGGSYLTPEAVILVKTYKAFCKEAENNVKELFRKYFEGI